MKVYITFGQSHVHSISGKTFDKDCIAVIECKDYKHGRQKAFEYFDGVFHNCYEKHELTDEMLSFFSRGIIEI